MIYPASDYTVLMPQLVGDISAGVIKIASSVLSGRDGNLIILGTVEVPKDASLSTGALSAQDYRRFLENLDLFEESCSIEIRSLVKVSRCAWDAICATAKDENCKLLIVPWPGDLNDKKSPYGISFDEMLKTSPIDIIIAREGRKQSFERILVPLRGGQHARLITNTALDLANKFGASLTIMRVLDADVSDKEVKKEEALLRSYLAKMGLVNGSYNLVTVRARNAATPITDAAKENDLVIMGASLERNTKERIGSVTRAVMNDSKATVLIIQSSSPSPSPAFISEESISSEEKPKPNLEISDIVDKWFAENTFHASEFSDIEKLVELKRKQGLTISLGLPTLNEELTIGNVINTVKAYLSDKYPLLDEIVVIDSDSTDRTKEIAKSLGVEVYRERDILPKTNSLPGKGSSLWKSLYVLKGDIIVWIDTDIKNIHPRFVYGLVGPMLKYPRIKYVKGFYRRPLKVDDQLIETGGGRVTELTARPLINLFFPELSGLVQPLSGEYAGKREILEKVGFYNGYGVEMGLLINILEQFGLDVIGQVDLIERIHRNQPLINLSKMAFAIVQVVIDRLENRHRVKLLREINRTMKLIKHEPGQFYLDLKAIEERMNPPMITVPEYYDVFKDRVIDAIYQ